MEVLFRPINRFKKSPRLLMEIHVLDILELKKRKKFRQFVCLSRL